jgi:hypothetical protein
MEVEVMTANTGVAGPGEAAGGDATPADKITPARTVEEMKHGMAASLPEGHDQ